MIHTQAAHTSHSVVHGQDFFFFLNERAVECITPSKGKYHSPNYCFQCVAPAWVTEPMNFLLLVKSAKAP